MPRTFGSGTSITVGTAGIPTSDQFTWLFVGRISVLTATQTMFGINSSAGSTRLQISTGGVFQSVTNGTVNSWSGSHNITTSSGWYFAAISKDATGAYRRCTYLYETGSGATSAVTGSGAGGSTDALTSAFIGASSAGSSAFRGDLAALGVFGRFVSNEADLTKYAFSLASWLRLGPGAMWVLDQDNVTVPVIDWLGSAHQTAITGTTVASASPPISYGHPIILLTQTKPAESGTAAITLPALTASGAGGVFPHVTGTPQHHQVTTHAATVTYTGGGDTGPGVQDLLFVNSDNVVSIPEFGSPIESRVGGQGSYIFAAPGGTTTATINLGGGINSPTNVLWVRVADTAGVDVTADAGFEGVSGNTTPSLTTPTLATAEDLVLAFTATHSGPFPTGLVWSAGYTEQISGTTGSSGSGGVFGSVAVKVPAGTAAESPSASWDSGVPPSDRYLLAVALLPPSDDGETGTAALTLPAITAAGNGQATASGTATLTLPAVQAVGAGAATTDATAAITLPAVQATGTGTAGADATSTITLPALSATGSAAATGTGTAAITLPALDADGAGAATASGAAALSLPAVQVAGTGETEDNATASGTIALPAVQAVGAGAASASGTATLQLPAIQAAGAGAASATATATLALPALTATGSGVGGVAGVAALTLPALLTAGLGQASADATGTLLFPALTLSGAGDAAEDVTATADLLLPPIVAAGAGQATATATGTLLLPALVVAGRQNATRRPGRFTTGAIRSRLTPGGHR